MLSTRFTVGNVVIWNIFNRKCCLRNIFKFFRADFLKIIYYRNSLEKCYITTISFYIKYLQTDILLSTGFSIKMLLSTRFLVGNIAIEKIFYNHVVIEIAFFEKVLLSASFSIMEIVIFEKEWYRVYFLYNILLYKSFANEKFCYRLNFLNKILLSIRFLVGNTRAVPEPKNLLVLPFFFRYHKGK